MTQTTNRANIILIAGLLINLSIGVLYAWSIIRTVLMDPNTFNWTSSQASLPFTLAAVAFSFAAFFGGRIQDKIGPRWPVTCGVLLVGLGMIISGLFSTPLGIAIGFGIITGGGTGLAYSCVLPPALKWFHPSKKGLVSGLVVGGFGISALYFAPIAGALLNNFDLQTTLMILGAVTIIIATPIAQFIKNPPVGYAPPAPQNFKETVENTDTSVEYTRGEMLKTKRFYMLFPMFLFSSSVGLMIIGSIAVIAREQIYGLDPAIVPMLVALLALMNAVGRVAGGFMSDKIGRVNALFVIFILQALNMVGFAFYDNLAMMIVGIIVVGFCFGTTLSVFPAITADQYGKKNFGGNYGIMYFAWGFGAVVAPVIAAFLHDIHGNFYMAYIICAAMMVAMIIVNILYKRNLATLK